MFEAAYYSEIIPRRYSEYFRAVSPGCAGARYDALAVYEVIILPQALAPWFRCC